MPTELWSSYDKRYFVRWLMLSSFVDITTICSSLGIDLTTQGSLEIGFCPFHAEENPSFTVYTDTNSFYCFSCGVGGGPLQLVSRLVTGVISWRDLERWCKEDLAPDKIPVRRTPPLREVAALVMSQQVVSLPDAPRSKDPFLASLGIIYIKEGRMAGRHIIPIILNGELVAYEARDFAGGLTPKVLIQPQGVKVHSYLWNIDSIVLETPVIVVEGIKGAIAVMHFGYPNVVSSFGSKLSADQVSLLLSKQPSEIIIAYDADTAGIVGAFDATTNLVAWVDLYMVDLPDGTDPWDVSRETWNRCFAQRVQVQADTRNKSLLNDFRREVLRNC